MIFNLFHRSLLKLPPEDAHHLALYLAKKCPGLGSLSGKFPDRAHQIKVGTINWSSPIGLAAGLDKNAEAVEFFSRQGFGSLEVGTVTLRPQSGNPKPRIFRYSKEQSLRNSMGFPNKGLQFVRDHLSKVKKNIPIGINLGKNKDTSAEESILDISSMVKDLRDLGDYFVVNVSSPNTPGLRELQNPLYLKDLFQEIKLSLSGVHKDLYLKISPDLDQGQVVSLAEFCCEMNLSGIMATNTTIMPHLGPGGVSGKLLKNKAFEIQKMVLSLNLPIEVIGIGGFYTFEDLLNFWNLGGKVIQIYTSYVYCGPQILREFDQDISHFLKRTKLKSLEDFFSLDLSQRQKLIIEFRNEIL